MPNFSLINSVLAVGGIRPPVNSAGPGSCSEKQPSVQAALNACFSNYKFVHNLISVERLSGGWPPENTIVASPEDLGVHDSRMASAVIPDSATRRALAVTRGLPASPQPPMAAIWEPMLTPLRRPSRALNNLGATSQVRD